jgi:hypothetical protein
LSIEAGTGAEQAVSLVFRILPQLLTIVDPPSNPNSVAGRDDAGAGSSFPCQASLPVWLGNRYDYDVTFDTVHHGAEQ